MDVIREQMKNIRVIAIAAFVLGLVLGWFVIGWGLWPVEWVDAMPFHLRSDMKEDYLRMVIDSDILRQDHPITLDRWAALQPGGEEVLDAIVALPGPQIDGVADFQLLVLGEEVATVPDEEASAPTEEESGEETGSPNTTILLVMCIVTIVLGGALAAYFIFGPGRQKEGSFDQLEEEDYMSHEVSQVDFSEPEGSPPMSQFMTTYMIGDDLFDDSFSIDSPTGEFLGECGVGISESIGIGEPKKVTAFEIWLFDKNDIQTITKVLMSKHAYDDDTLRARLAAKGDPFLVEIGEETQLETATLRLVTRVVDMSYGSGASPADSFFDRATLELAVWLKE